MFNPPIFSVDGKLIHSIFLNKIITLYLAMNTQNFLMGRREGEQEDKKRGMSLILTMGRRQKSKKISKDMGKTPAMIKKMTAFSLIKTLFQQILLRLIEIPKRVL